MTAEVSSRTSSIPSKAHVQSVEGSELLPPPGSRAQAHLVCQTPLLPAVVLINLHVLNP